MDWGESSDSCAHELWGGIGINLCAPGTPWVGGGSLLDIGSQQTFLYREADGNRGALATPFLSIREKNFRTTRSEEKRGFTTESPWVLEELDVESNQLASVKL